MDKQYNEEDNKELLVFKGMLQHIQKVLKNKTSGIE